MNDTQNIDALTEGRAPFIEENGMIVRIYANDTSNPTLPHLLDMFYAGVAANTLGLMVAKNSETGAEETLLIGIVPEETPDGEYYVTIPLARLLSKEESAVYMAPDGDGGYIDHRNTE